ncbi:TIR domain-containing protein [Leifsonia aquatica]|uniref:TIR domain-containing protein n=1 Tax=Leifsonia aquatica TaxID=144185 RepID=UPI003820D726
MAKSVFYSFHYDRDNWRVQQIINMGALEGQPVMNAQQWEEVKRKGEAGIKNWIGDQMAYKRAVVVLVGAQTAGRRWVQYEITKAWNDKKPIVGVRINGLADSNSRTDQAGANPFEKITLPSGKTLASYIPLITPSGWTSQQVHADIARNLTSWVDRAYQRS